MEFTGDIRRSLLRANGAEPLGIEASERLWGALLDGALDDVEIGAIVGVLAVAGETREELLGLHRAVQSRCARCSPPGGGGIVALPAYGAFAGEAPVVALAAMLLRRFQLRVVVHGLLDSPCGVSCARVLRELDVMPSASLGHADGALAANSVAFVPVQLLSPAFARLLMLRSRLGIETSAHRVAQALDPTDGQAMRIAISPQGSRAAAMDALIGSMGGDALTLTWSGTLPPSTLALRPRIERWRAGVRELLFEADAQDVAAMTAPQDAAQIAANVHAITTGRAPLPVAALNLVAASLYATGLAPDLARAKAAAAVAGGRLAA